MSIGRLFSKLKPTGSIWLICLFLSSVLVGLAWNMYPVPDGDASHFLPPIKTFASSGLLQNKLQDLSFQTDPLRQGRFLYYTPGFPVLVGSLLSLAGLESYRSVLVLLALIRSATVFVFARSILLILKSRQELVNTQYHLLALSLVISNALFLFSSNGRPEILSMLIISSVVLVSISPLSELPRHIAIGFGIGLVFPVSIANGCISISFYLIYLAFNVKSLPRRAIFISWALLISCLSLLLSYQIPNLSITEGIQGIALHGRMALSRSDTSFTLVLRYWRTWAMFALLAGIYLLRLLTHHVRQNYLNIAERVWLVSSGLIVIILIYIFGFRAAPIHYNFYAFLPLYQIMALYLLFDLKAGRQKVALYISWVVACGALFLSLVFPLRDVALFPYYLASGNTYSEARQAFKDINTDACYLVYTPGLFVLDDSQVGSMYRVDESLEFLPSERIANEANHKQCVVALVQDVNNRNRSRIPVVKNMELIKDWADRSPYTSFLRAMRILNSPQGYSFRAFKDDFQTAPGNPATSTAGSLMRDERL